MHMPPVPDAANITPVVRAVVTRAGRVVRAFRATVLGVLALVVGEAVYAVLRPVPKLVEHDASGVVGGGSRPPLSIVVVGDSITTGPGVAGPEDIWVRQLAVRLAVDRQVVVHSWAIGGARAIDVVRRQLDPATRHPADVAFVSVGANDVIRATSQAAFERHLSTIVMALSHSARLVVVTGVGDFATIPRLVRPLSLGLRRRGRTLDRVASRVAARHQALKVATWELTTEPFRTWDGMFGPDRFHPTALGHRVLADAAEETIRAHLPG
jgi:lysophospholipase L1-like esterase